VKAGNVRGSCYNPIPIRIICNTFSRLIKFSGISFELLTNLKGEAGLELILKRLLKDSFDGIFLFAAEA
jgi:hypothetical protein